MCVRVDRKLFYGTLKAVEPQRRFYRYLNATRFHMNVERDVPSDGHGSSRFCLLFMFSQLSRLTYLLVLVVTYVS